MAFAYRPSPTGGFGPATPSPTSEQGDQDQRDSLQQQHNNLLSVLFDKNLAHGGAAVLCSLATPSAPVDPLPVSTPPFSSSSWASSLLAANRGTLWFEGARRPPRHPATLLSSTHSIHMPPDPLNTSTHASHAPIVMGARIHKSAHKTAHMLHSLDTLQLSADMRAHKRKHTHTYTHTHSLGTSKTGRRQVLAILYDPAAAPTSTAEAVLSSPAPVAHSSAPWPQP